MRRIFCFIFPLFLIIPYFLCCGASEVSAAESEPELQSIDVLSYTMPNGGAISQVVVNNSSVVKFNMPFQYGAIFYDMIVEIPVTLNAVSVVRSDGFSESLTVSHLENYSYRVYGQSSLRINTGNLGVQFTTSVSTNYTVNFVKFDVYTIASLGIPDYGEMSIAPNNDTSVGDGWYRQETPGYPLVQDFLTFSSQVQFFDFRTLFSSVNWRKYDYLDFSFSINAAAINSISAYISPSSEVYRYLPFEISYLNGTTIDKNEYVGSGSTTVIPSYTVWNVVMRVYIPSSYRLSGSLYIQVDGQYHGPASRATLKSVNGYYYVDVPNPSLVKLDQITAAIKESLSSSSEDNAAAEEFTDSMATQKEQMAANQNQLNSIDKPSSSDLGAMSSPDIVLDQTGMGYLTTIIRPITNNRLVLSMLTLSATLALIGYVFFGKKG